MNSKTLVFLGMFIGSLAGGYLPVLWGGEALSYTSVLLSGVGGLIGIYAGFKLGN